MPNSFKRVLVTSALAGLMAFSSTASSALEVTAGGKDASLAGLEVATGIQLSTIRTIVETAINAMSDRIGLLEGRVTGLEVTAEGRA